MWKRFQGHGREKEKQIGNPVLVETTYDEDQLRHIPNISDVRNANYQSNAQHSGPPPHNSLSPPGLPRDYRVSEVPTVSSIYSQPSPELRYNWNPTAVPPEGFTDVSPPSSPEPEGQQQRNPDQSQRSRSMRDVSPVDENRDRFGGAERPGSNIPVLRKAPPSIRDKEPSNTQKFWGGKVAPNSKVRWDEYSGEPTSGTGGKTGQVSPKSYAHAPLSTPNVGRAMGYQVSVSGPQEHAKKNATFSERATRFGTKPSPVDTSAKLREAWKGASGRVAIVQPMEDRPSKQPLNFQRKNNPDKNEAARKEASNSLAPTVKRVPVAADTSPVADHREGLDTHEDPIKPIVPLKVGRNSPPRSIASPTSPHYPTNQAAYSYPSPITPTNNQPPGPGTGDQGELKPESAQQHSTPPNTKAVRRSIEGTPGSTSSKDNGPTSRFSWTTYNTNTTYQHSPPPSPPPPMPTTTVAATQPIPAAPSILNRRRPVPPSDNVPSRKPITASTVHPRTMTSEPPSPRPGSTFSTNTQKALPRPPTELTAADHVDILEAQMDDLRLRRSNVNRLLQDLNNQAPPNPLVTDFRRMRIVKQRKKEFEDELAEIKREEHDVGLRLHRAWRKRERDDPNGSESAIWIRRITK
ncbi:hypothetical protein K469DRAFT_558493 [Zopfia rhizophila CBS 207.26]|uniref:Uncharacterized protein n=1 Tax=Zopfia rhizophila CBS 207.26 TaxID=1314779 RepID=A0A6A6EK25_9PEZI|nr:hypothetical protein K469DRAFT_558493 [Zopfia rhizophila CBS 207.26]